MKTVAVLNRFFNTENDPPGYQKLGAGKFATEIKALSKDEKQELAQMAADEMGVELEPAA